MTGFTYHIIMSAPLNKSMPIKRKVSDAEIRRLIRPYLLRQEKSKRQAMYPWIIIGTTFALLCAATILFLAMILCQ